MRRLSTRGGSGADGGVTLLYARVWLGLTAGILWLVGVGLESGAVRGAGLAGLVVALGLRWLPRLRRSASDDPLSGDGRR